MSTIEFWRTAGILFTAMWQSAFILLYLTFPWWRDFLGRSLFLKSGSFAILVDVAVAGRIWDWQHEDATFVVLYWLVGIGSMAQFIAFVRVKMEKSGSVPFPETTRTEA